MVSRTWPLALSSALLFLFACDETSVEPNAEVLLESNEAASLEQEEEKGVRIITDRPSDQPGGVLVGDAGRAWFDGLRERGAVLAKSVHEAPPGTAASDTAYASFNLQPLYPVTDRVEAWHHPVEEVYTHLGRQGMGEGTFEASASHEACESGCDYTASGPAFCECTGT